MKSRNTDRTYDWNGHKGLPISFSHLTDEQMAGTVRMLMRHDLGHEGIVCGARDRIMCLVKEKAALEARVAELEADPARQTKMEPIGFARKTNVAALRDGLQGSVFIYQNEAGDLEPIYAGSPAPEKHVKGQGDA